MQLAASVALWNAGGYETLALALESLPGVGSLDTAKNFLQLLALAYIAKHKVKVQAKGSAADAVSEAEASKEEESLESAYPAQGRPKTKSKDDDAEYNACSTFAGLDSVTNARGCGFAHIISTQIPFLRQLKPSQRSALSTCTASVAQFRAQFTQFKPLAAVTDRQVRFVSTGSG